jgi:hypothetical protein
MNEYIFTVFILIGLYIFFRLIKNDYIIPETPEINQQSSEIKKSKYIKRGVIIELNLFNYEYLGAAIEYFYYHRYESVDLFLPTHFLSYNDEWIRFFRTNYKFKINLNLIDDVKGKYDYAFYITLIDEPKFFVDAIKYGGIIYNNDDKNIKYMLDNKHIDQFSFNPFIKTDKHLSNFKLDPFFKLNANYINNYYPKVDYFVIDNSEKNSEKNNEMNIAKLTTIFSNLDKKWLYITSNKSSGLYNKITNAIIPANILSTFFKSTAIECIDAHPTSIIKCFLYKKCVYLPINDTTTSKYFSFSDSCFTPFYLPKNISDIYPNYKNFIPFTTDENLTNLLKN